LRYQLISHLRGKTLPFEREDATLDGLGRPGLEPGTNALKGRCSTN
jgi:hypothetical protein